MKITLDIYSNTFNFSALEVEAKGITLTAGKNNIGKTFMNKLVWYVQHIHGVYTIHRQLSHQTADQMFKEYAKIAFRWTFSEPDEISGSVKIETDDNIMEIKIEEGEVIGFNHKIIDVESYINNGPGLSLYCSAPMRSFTEFDKYTSMKKMLNIDPTLPHDDVDKLCQIYKLYDVLWFENIALKIASFKENGFQEKADIIEQLITSGDDLLGNNAIRSVDSFHITEAGPCVRHENGSSIPLSRLSIGSQSMLILALFAL